MKRFEIVGSEDLVTQRALTRLTMIPRDSVLVVVRSGILSRTLPVAVNTVPVTVNQDMRAFIPHPDVSARYLAWQLIANEHDILRQCAKDGTTVASIDGPALASYPLAIAPVVEQCRVVEKLDELLSEHDAAVAELKTVQRKLAQYRQSLLRAAVEGALTADWRASREARGEPQESGAELLQRILVERRAQWEQMELTKFSERGSVSPIGWQGRYRQPAEPELSLVPALPFSWTWATVDQLSPDDLANGRSVPTASHGAKVLRLTSVKHGRIDLSEHKTGAWSEVAASRFAVAENDLLIVRGNGSLALVGRAGLVGSVSEQIAFPDTLIRLRVIDRLICSKWIAIVWESQSTRTHFERRARTSAGIYKISQGDIREVPVPVPSIDEQIHIIRLVELHDEQMHAVARELESALKQAAAQRKNILKAAFAGQLVPQDPNDEPASVMLDRIRAERAAKPAPARKLPRKARAPA